MKTIGLIGGMSWESTAHYYSELNTGDRESVHRIIYDELCQGRILPESRQAYMDIAERLAEDGARAIILGCTEIGMLLKSEDTDIPLYDTTLIHAREAVEWALKHD